MASVAVQLLLLAAVLLSLRTEAALLEERLFESFISNYSKSYGNDPETRSVKFRVFQQSLARQRKLNEYEREHGGTAVYGINQFSDLTPEQFREMHLSPMRKLSPHPSMYQEPEKNWSTAANHFDWREKNVIGSIRNQEKCGSCWAFAVVETIESAYAIEQHQALNFTLSSQQLISCDVSTYLGLAGCSGGVLKNAFGSIQNNMVVVEESVYPFQSGDGNDPACNTNLPQRGLVLTNFTYLDSASLDQMMTLLQISPLTTSVNAVAWQDYTGGIVQHHCTDQYVDHAVQVVGYDLRGEVPYWIVRNTWGTSWGEKGYVRVRHGVNMCGIRDEIAAVYSVKGMNI